MTDLCHQTVEKLSANPDPLLELEYPVVVVGDLHGSIEDLLRIFRIFKPPPQTRYLFLGDYVDRGDNSLEVMTILMALYCKYPDKVYLLRGNHEFSHINKVYGFYEEIVESYRKPTLWAIFQRVFSFLPLAAVVNKETFCVHGGLSPYLEKISTIRSISLPISNYDGQSLISDLVWSDPSDKDVDYESNNRGSGVLFGKQAVKDFLSKNNLKFMIRGHQCTTTGVHAFAGTLGMTVFSCSDYCRLLANRSGCVHFRGNGEVTFFSLGDDTEDGNCEKAIMLLVDGRMGLQRSTKSYVRKEPVTLDTPPTNFSIKLIPLGQRNAVTLQGEHPPPLIPRKSDSAPGSDAGVTKKKKKKIIKKKKGLKKSKTQVSLREKAESSTSSSTTDKESSSDLPTFLTQPNEMPSDDYSLDENDKPSIINTPESCDRKCSPPPPNSLASMPAQVTASDAQIALQQPNDAKPKKKRTRRRCRGPKTPTIDAP
ncbi:Ser/Thr protein phosphatase, putative [Trichomonas vaginalis G3]|uniref:Serine/threonine-protein phosphatase n=1 Tax=Trichomonas vaginalis (strain ATCC PRA-98 / G3) TaxID=412133 RepID=A2ECQ2_TRIV3|nr:phosphoprotein phosphatase protein [Trichomonas vaginalis G3]EAY09548.1 Ser/Thr protein phosphatase, putative [Trichomonas vaginalis G3]KAI5533176.1 phosphoprotein phosphatase protein [Trichomonas vaginalis G3]|eukprot:XP_001321771.1 Ser/Thr protein phosphatase [Trichomonas vaginalis G3]